MTVSNPIERQFCCAIVPTYNNADTLEKVLTDVARHISHIIVVNDGSTDDSGLLLSNLKQNNPLFFTSNPALITSPVTLDIIAFPTNKGKGAALQKGFQRAVEAGFRYAITIDSDGQHFADDIPNFIDKIQKYPDSLIVGSRNMKQDGVPDKSSFGNRFSNFWYKIVTGIKLPDTQSGFRLYPLERLRNMNYFTGKYEFEVEILVRAAWKGCNIRWTPVKTYYAPEERRVSHFRPFSDFARISLLNTVLVLITFLWIKPRDMIRRFNWQIIKRFILLQFANRKKSTLNIALSSGFGIFMSIIPIWGFQLVAAIALAHLMKLNKAIVAIAVSITFPPTIPVVLYISFLIGGWLVENPTSIVSLDTISLEFVKSHFNQYLFGSLFFAVTAAIAVTLLVWLAVATKRKYSLKPVSANERTET